MTYYDRNKLDALEKRYRVNLLNSISGVKSANLIGSMDNAGRTNLAIFSSVVHLGANPPLLGFILRPTTVRRDTYNNIKETGQFTINHVSSEIVEAAHQTSGKYPADMSEFKATGLTADFKADFKAPFVKESPVQIGMTFVDEIKIKQNDTLMIIGEVTHLELSDELIEEDGTIRLDEADVVGVTGLNSYNALERVAKLDYVGNPKKSKPDNVAYDNKSQSYTAGLVSYGTNVGAPKIVQDDVVAWKRRGVNKVNHHIKTKFDELKSDYEAMMEEYRWNEELYKASFNFEPVVGETYNAYKKETGEVFLSLIGPKEWDKEHLGTFKLNYDLMWVKC